MNKNIVENNQFVTKRIQQVVVVVVAMMERQNELKGEIFFQQRNEDRI